MTSRVLARCLVSILISLLTSSAVSAQASADLVLDQEAQDSILADYSNIFPIWGRQAIEAGFELPRPAGLNLVGLYMNQQIAITNLQVGLNDGPLVPFDFVQFGDTDSKVSTVNARADLWLFPFLNIYGLYGLMSTSTKVEIVEPLNFVSEVDFDGQYFGFGMTAAIGIKRNWLSVDVNWTWTDLDKLNELVRARVLGIRYGRTFVFGGRRLSTWVGTMGQTMLNTTTGTVVLNEVLPPEIEEALNNYQSEQWYQDLAPPSQAKVDDFVARIQAFGENSITYSLDKEPKHKWNLLLGAQYELSRHWQIRTEFGMINRFSAMLNINYRFGFR